MKRARKRGPRQPYKAQRSRTYRSTQARARMVPLPRQRGYLRQGGYYGRYANGGELKFHDVDLDDAVVAGAGGVTDSINKIAQGVTESQRVGRKCVIRSINWRYLVTLPLSAAIGSPDTLRMIMYIDKQANGATAATTDLLESADFQSFNNLSNSGRFRTILDRTIDILRTNGAGDGTTNDAAGTNINGTFFKKCAIPIEFNSTTGAITEIRSNNIGVMLFSHGGVCGFESKIRLRFSDG